MCSSSEEDWSVSLINDEKFPIPMSSFNWPPWRLTVAGAACPGVNSMLYRPSAAEQMSSNLRFVCAGIVRQ